MGELRTRKRGKSWEWSFETAKVGGKRNSKSKGGYRTKAEAIAAGTKAKAEYDSSGRVFTPSTVSLSDYLDYWLENHVRKNLAHNTYLNYEKTARIHIKPYLGNYRLGGIEPDIIQSWIDQVKYKGFSANTVKTFFNCLSGALNYAVMPLKYIKYNPCEHVKLSRIRENPKLKERREYILTPEDWGALTSRFPEGSAYFLPLMVGYHTGTRLSETYGIDLLEDVDLDNGLLHIRHQVQKEGKMWYQRPPKYESYRVIDLDRALAKALRREIARRKERKLFYGQYYTKAYVLPDGAILQRTADIEAQGREIMPLAARENGKMYTPDSFNYCARVAHNELGLPLFHSHSLRHTHGTILAENGASPKTVMERLGHKDISITMNRYIFNTEKMRSDAVRIFEKAVL